VHERWKAFWARLFGRSNRRSRREEKVLEYVVYRIHNGARLQEVVQEEYVRRMVAKNELERMLADPRIVEGLRERLRRGLKFEDMPPRRTSRGDRPGFTTKGGRWPEDGTRKGRSGAGASGRSQ